MAAGATVAADVVTTRDKEICARLAGRLAAHGLVFVGIASAGAAGGLLGVPGTGSDVGAIVTCAVREG